MNGDVLPISEALVVISPISDFFYIRAASSFLYPCLHPDTSPYSFHLLSPKPRGLGSSVTIPSQGVASLTANSHLSPHASLPPATPTAACVTTLQPNMEPHRTCRGAASVAATADFLQIPGLKKREAVAGAEGIPASPPFVPLF